MSQDELRIQSQYVLPDNTDKIPLRDMPKDQSQYQKRLEAKNSSIIHRTKEEKLCNYIAMGETCKRETCRLSHDISAYLKTRQNDQAQTTPCLFSQKGYRCPYGVRCIHFLSHTTVSEETVVDEAGNEQKTLVPHFTDHEKAFPPPEQNDLSLELKERIRKNKYNYNLSKSIIVPQMNTLFPPNPPQKSKPDTSDVQPTPDIQPLKREHSDGNDTIDTVLSKDKCEDQSSIIYPEKEPDTTSKPGKFHNKLYLAPLTTVGNLPFRRICVEFGVDMTCSEMVLARRICEGTNSELSLLHRHPSETCFGVQVAASHVDKLSQTVEMILKECKPGVDFFDFNSACPVDQFCNQGMCAALLDRPRRLEQLVRGFSLSIKTVSDSLGVQPVPLLVKMRMGVSDNKITAHKYVPHLKREWGVEALVLHGRTKQQRYSKLADWEYIGRCYRDSRLVSSLLPPPTSGEHDDSPLSIFGNGDVFNWRDAAAALDGIETELGRTNPVCDSIMVARGALTKPWIFSEIKARKDMDISATERLEIIRRYSEYGMEHWGSDSQGVEKTRQFLLEWLSFLYRYVPVGLVEGGVLAEWQNGQAIRPDFVTSPVFELSASNRQQLNVRYPRYTGRNELETLLSSDKASDWISITEMFLGKVPDGFQFHPKHKSNAY
ncbi:putative tRNA-dihydrouridine synthase B [Blattamonas nauphoetae]|uniref:tRNA-dihydrouridine(47) synthase [NAD(P)(+)] n=1 Tax=Blattamonas nauphoetae TaxID=2049346 RepID=A0ABQ9YA36_9EUKA|nr:putative tRNA-dihydrouridine synthase B [Blattamonas nauphoetae]